MQRTMTRGPSATVPPSSEAVPLEPKNQLDAWRHASVVIEESRARAIRVIRKVDPEINPLLYNEQLDRLIGQQVRSFVEPETYVGDISPDERLQLLHEKCATARDGDRLAATLNRKAFHDLSEIRGTKILPPPALCVLRMLIQPIGMARTSAYLLQKAYFRRTNTLSESFKDIHSLFQTTPDSHLALEHERVQKSHIWKVTRKDPSLQSFLAQLSEDDDIPDELRSVAS